MGRKREEQTEKVERTHDSPGTQGYINIYLSRKPQIVFGRNNARPLLLLVPPPSPPSFKRSHYAVLDQPSGRGSGRSLVRCVIRGERGLECTDSCLSAAHSTVRSVGVRVDSQTPFLCRLLMVQRKPCPSTTRALWPRWRHCWWNDWFGNWVSSQMRGGRDRGMLW